MKKIILGMILTILSLNAWEVNTHRAIDRKAIEDSLVKGNLKTFINNSGIPTDDSYYNNEEFEGYNITYLDYIENNRTGETNGVAQWHQVFSGKPSYQNMIEAGTILEDAQWPNHGTFTKGEKLKAADGRFNSHFADPQDGFKKLTIGLGSELIGTDIGKPDWTDAITWATTGADLEDEVDGFDRRNYYSYQNALNYFKQGFTEENATERKTFQAKMFVALGHIMHVVNDMNVPAHTRDDGHPQGDSLEWWAKGGESMFGGKI